MSAGPCESFWHGTRGHVCIPVATPSIPGAVGAGSAVEALLSDWQETRFKLPADHPMTVDEFCRHWFVGPLAEAIAQDADRTSRGGALGEALASIRTHNGEPVTVDNLRWAATHEALSRSWIFDVLTGLADARATRPAPDDQAEGECGLHAARWSFGGRCNHPMCAAARAAKPDADEGGRDE